MATLSKLSKCEGLSFPGPDVWRALSTALQPCFSMSEIGRSSLCQRASVKAPCPPRFHRATFNAEYPSYTGVVLMNKGFSTLHKQAYQLLHLCHFVCDISTFEMLLLCSPHVNMLFCKPPITIDQPEVRLHVCKTVVVFCIEVSGLPLMLLPLVLPLTLLSPPATLLAFAPHQ